MVVGGIRIMTKGVNRNREEKCKGILQLVG